VIDLNRVNLAIATINIAVNERAQTWSDGAVTIIKANARQGAAPTIDRRRYDWRCKACAHHKRCWGKT
jgi:hypothetical protein